jgi:pyridoxine 4-dehydrogenase
VHRLGYGAMRIAGPGIWGPPEDPEGAKAVLRRALELGVDFIDTADSYGPEVSEELICEALYPYPPELVIATKAGLARSGPDRWHPLGRPEYLRQQCEMSLRRLKVEAIDLFQLHRVDPKVPASEQFGLLAELVAEGKVRKVGLSEVDVHTIEEAMKVVPIASVQNRYNIQDRSSEPVLQFCEAHSVAFIPWFPLGSGTLAHQSALLTQLAAKYDVTPFQVALAWLLGHSPVTLPIPGTSRIEHLEENCAAALLVLDQESLA